MKLLVLDATDRLGRLVAELGTEFETAHAHSVPQAIELLATAPADTVLVHRDLGQSAVLDLLRYIRSRPADCVTGVLVITASVDVRVVIEIMRAGAYDVLCEESLSAREVAHAARNAAAHARALARFNRAAAQSRAILVVGSGDAVDAIVLLLEASGWHVQQAGSVREACEHAARPGTVLVDLSQIDDGEDLIRILNAR